MFDSNGKVLMCCADPQTYHWFYLLRDHTSPDTSQAQTPTASFIIWTASPVSISRCLNIISVKHVGVIKHAVHGAAICAQCDMSGEGFHTGRAGASICTGEMRRKHPAGAEGSEGSGRLNCTEGTCVVAQAGGAANPWTLCEGAHHLPPCTSEA